MSTGFGSEVGLIRLSDGTLLKFKISIVDIREFGSSPFGGVNLSVKGIGGVSTLSVPEDLRKAVSNKPLVPPIPPDEGWEIIDIVEQKPPMVKEVVETSKGKFEVSVVAEAVMAARNMQYKTEFNEPVYWVSWVWKISWKPVREG